MMADDLGKQLHDKKTRGVTLSAGEHAQLEAWYAVQDQQESEQLKLTGASDLVSLQDQVDIAIQQLQSVTQRIQKLATQNDILQKEIALLQDRLSYHQTSQAA